MNILSWSGGKDSTASIILAYENNIKIDEIIITEVMFDKTRNISGENPIHINWIYNKAIPIINKMGYKVRVLHDELDYISIFNSRIKKSSIPERNGLKVGFPLGMNCYVNRLKMRPIRKYHKENKIDIEYLGIAADEPIRLERLKRNQISILDKYHIEENQTFTLCKEYNLLSPIYSNPHIKRGGCWFCPNSGLVEFAQIKFCYPDLWNELYKLSLDTELVSQNFSYSRIFGEIDKKISISGHQLFIEV